MAETRLSPLQHNVVIVDPKTGLPEPWFIQWINQLMEEKLTTDTLAEEAVQGSRLVDTGLGLTGGGDLTTDRTISLDAALDNLTDVDTTTTPPADGDSLVFDNGSGLWVPQAIVGGSGSNGERTLIPPNVANFTYGGGGSGSMPGTTNGMMILAPNNGATYTARAVSNTNPASFANFTLISRLLPLIPHDMGGGASCQMFIRNSSNGRMLVLNDGGNSSVSAWQRWTNDTTFSATITTRTSSKRMTAFPWRRFVVTGSSVAPSVSPDGINWETAGMAAEPYATFLTAAGGAADQIGVGSHTVNGSWNYTICTHFEII